MDASRTDAKKDQFVGNVKETVGGAGNIQETAANARAMDQAAGAVKGAYNSLTGNTGDEAANKVQDQKGEAQKSWNA